MQGDVVSVGPSSLPCSDTSGIEIFGLFENQTVGEIVFELVFSIFCILFAKG